MLVGTSDFGTRLIQPDTATWPDTWVPKFEEEMCWLTEMYPAKSHPSSI